ncbi:MAG: glutamine synthetase, partial [Pelagibacteraceae bacterium]|nr:glutamine synthetase [Pelagibacteraceae bacterium]
PYLVFAANLAAGYLGLKNKIKPSEETKKSVYDNKKSSLPKNMEEAISLFEKDEQITEVFNQKFIRTIAAIRRVEYQAYLKVISSWEREFLLLNV